MTDQTVHPEALPGATAFRTVIVVLTVILYGVVLFFAGNLLFMAWQGNRIAARGLVIAVLSALIYAVCVEIRARWGARR